MLFYSLGQKDFPQRHQTKKKHGIALIFGDEWNQNSSLRVRCLLIFVWERSGVQFLCLGKIHTTSTIVVCLVRSGPPGFWSVFVSWELNQTGIKALNLSKKEWGWSSSRWSPAPYAYIYITRFFSTIKYIKYNYTHTSSHKSMTVYDSLWKRCRIFFSLTPKNNS